MDTEDRHPLCPEHKTLIVKLLSVKKTGSTGSVLHYADKGNN